MTILLQTMKAQRGSRGTAPHSLTSVLDGGWVLNATPRPFCPPEKRPSIHCTGGSVWTSAENLAPNCYSIAGAVQPTARRYTD